MDSPTEQGPHRRRRRRRRHSGEATLRNWAKDDAPEADPQDERNLGLVVAVVVGLVIVLLLAYVLGQVQYQAPF